MDNTRRKAVLAVLRGIAPWANPHLERWNEQDALVIDVVGKQRLVLVMASTGEWFYGFGEPDGGRTSPTSTPESLGLTRSEGGQVVAGTFMTKVMDALDAARRQDSLSNEDRLEAHTRLEHLLALSG